MSFNDIDVNNGEEMVKEKEKDVINKDKDEEILEIGNTNNTLAQVNSLLKQIEGNNNNNKYEDDEQEDEDIEKYLKSLENK